MSLPRLARILSIICTYTSLGLMVGSMSKYLLPFSDSSKLLIAVISIAVINYLMALVFEKIWGKKNDDELL